MKTIVFAALTVTFLAGADAAIAQDKKTVAIVCHCQQSLPIYKAFESHLAELGWQDGENMRLIRHFSGGDPALLTASAKQVVDARPDVIFAGFTPAVIALQKHKSNIPIIFAGVSDASEIGAATHFNRPEGNFTGSITINRELMPKRLEVLKEALPDMRTVGYLANPNYGLHKPQLEEMNAAAKRLGVQLVTVTTTTPTQFEAAFAELAAKGSQGLIVQQDPLFTGQAARIVALAEKNKLPTIYALRNFFDAGGLMWYGADIPATFARAADYVDRVLKGARPGDLPIERPAKVYLTINGKLAQQMGIALSPTILSRADEVIE